jgi:hypothetical protein
VVGVISVFLNWLGQFLLWATRHFAQENPRPALLLRRVCHWISSKELRLMQDRKIKQE